MKVIYSLLFVLALCSCGEDLDCQTCNSDTAGGTVTIKFCQDGPDVMQTTGTVVTVIPNANLTDIIAGQEMVAGVTCN